MHLLSVATSANVTCKTVLQIFAGRQSQRPRSTREARSCATAPASAATGLQCSTRAGGSGVPSLLRPTYLSITGRLAYSFLSAVGGISSKWLGSSAEKQRVRTCAGGTTAAAQIPLQRKGKRVRSQKGNWGCASRCGEWKPGPASRPGVRPQAQPADIRARTPPSTRGATGCSARTTPAPSARARRARSP